MEINLIEALQEVFGVDNVIVLDDDKAKIVVKPESDPSNGVNRDSDEGTELY